MNPIIDNKTEENKNKNKPEKVFIDSKTYGDTSYMERHFRTDEQIIREYCVGGYHE